MIAELVEFSIDCGERRFFGGGGHLDPGTDLGAVFGVELSAAATGDLPLSLLAVHRGDGFADHGIELLANTFEDALYGGEQGLDRAIQIPEDHDQLDQGLGRDADGLNNLFVLGGGNIREEVVFDLHVVLYNVVEGGVKSEVDGVLDFGGALDARLGDDGDVLHDDFLS